MSTNSDTKLPFQVLKIRFNQDSGCFACATSDGIRIFNSDPLKIKTFLNFGPVTHAEMLFRSNLIAYVPANHGSLLPSNAVNIFDNQQKKHVLEIAFASPVLSIRMTRTKLIVVLRNKIHIFSFPNSCKLLHILETADNPLGLCEIAFGNEPLIVFPFNKKYSTGAVHLVSLEKLEKDSSSNPRVIQAHENPIVAMALNDSGSMLTTCSSKGTLIRVFSTKRCEQIFEFRRGTEAAVIQSLIFSGDSNFVAVSSNTGTLHIYSVQDPLKSRIPSLQNMFKGTTKDICSFKQTINGPSISTFSDPNHVISIGFDGTYHKYIFSSNGHCERDEYDLFLDGVDGTDF